MTRDDAYLFDILESARLALEHLGDVQRDEFEKDIMLQDAVVRRLEIIGELQDEFLKKQNRSTHTYLGRICLECAMPLSMNMMIWI